MADLNGDGISDLLYADRSGDVSFYSRDAAGGLQPKQNIIADGKKLSPGSAASICVTDWNRDGLFDIIIGHGIWKTDYPLQLYINKGSKTEYLYENPDTLKCNGEPIGATYPQIEFADFTGDGIRDLVLLDCFYNSQMGTDTTNLFFFENSGTDSEPLFLTKELLLHGGLKIGLKLGTLDAKDINGDGGMDLAVTGTGREIKIYYGKPGDVPVVAPIPREIVYSGTILQSGNKICFGEEVTSFSLFTLQGQLLQQGKRQKTITFHDVGNRMLLLRWRSGGTLHYRKLILR